jgi:hypothetical protein
MFDRKKSAVHTFFTKTLQIFDVDDEFEELLNCV